MSLINLFHGAPEVMSTKDNDGTPPGLDLSLFNRIGDLTFILDEISVTKHVNVIFASVEVVAVTDYKTIYVIDRPTMVAFKKNAQPLGVEGIITFQGKFFAGDDPNKDITMRRLAKVVYSSDEVLIVMDSKYKNLYVVDKRIGVSLGCRMNAIFELK